MGFYYNDFTFVRVEIHCPGGFPFFEFVKSHFNFSQVEKDQTINSYIWTIKTLRLVSFKREQIYNACIHYPK